MPKKSKNKFFYFFVPIFFQFFYNFFCLKLRILTAAHPSQGARLQNLKSLIHPIFISELKNIGCYNIYVFGFAKGIPPKSSLHKKLDHCATPDSQSFKQITIFKKKTFKNKKH
jgi:hypothetical protein